MGKEPERPLERSARVLCVLKLRKLSPIGSDPTGLSYGTQSQECMKDRLILDTVIGEWMIWLA